MQPDHQLFDATSMMRYGQLHILPSDSPDRKVTVRRAQESELKRVRDPKFKVPPQLPSRWTRIYLDNLYVRRCAPPSGNIFLVACNEQLAMSATVGMYYAQTPS